MGESKLFTDWYEFKFGEFKFFAVGDNLFDEISDFVGYFSVFISDDDIFNLSKVM